MNRPYLLHSINKEMIECRKYITSNTKMVLFVSPKIFDHIKHWMSGYPCDYTNIEIYGMKTICNTNLIGEQFYIERYIEKPIPSQKVESGCMVKGG